MSGRRTSWQNTTRPLRQFAGSEPAPTLRPRCAEPAPTLRPLPPRPARAPAPEPEPDLLPVEAAAPELITWWVQQPLDNDGPPVRFIVRAYGQADAREIAEWYLEHAFRGRCDGPPEIWAEPQLRAGYWYTPTGVSRT